MVPRQSGAINRRGQPRVTHHNSAALVQDLSCHCSTHVTWEKCPSVMGCECHGCGLSLAGCGDPEVRLWRNRGFQHVNCSDRHVGTGRRSAVHPWGREGKEQRAGGEGEGQVDVEDKGRPRRVGTFVRMALTGKGRLGRPTEPPGRTVLLTVAGLASSDGDPPGCSGQRRDTLETGPHARPVGRPRARPPHPARSQQALLLSTSRLAMEKK